MRLVLSLLVLAWLPATLASQQNQYDIIIRNGRIIDGTGSPWYAGDIAIREGRIAEIGSAIKGNAGRTIDAAHGRSRGGG